MEVYMDYTTLERDFDSRSSGMIPGLAIRHVLVLFRDCPMELGGSVTHSSSSQNKKQGSVLGNWQESQLTGLCAPVPHIQNTSLSGVSLIATRWYVVSILCDIEDRLRALQLSFLFCQDAFFLHSTPSKLAHPLPIAFLSLFYHFFTPPLFFSLLFSFFAFFLIFLFFVSSLGFSLFPSSGSFSSFPCACSASPFFFLSLLFSSSSYFSCSLLPHSHCVSLFLFSLFSFSSLPLPPLSGFSRLRN